MILVSHGVDNPHLVNCVISETSNCGVFCFWLILCCQKLSTMQFVNCWLLFFHGVDERSLEICLISKLVAHMVLMNDLYNWLLFFCYNHHWYFVVLNSNHQWCFLFPVSHGVDERSLRQYLISKLVTVFDRSFITTIDTLLSETATISGVFCFWSLTVLMNDLSTMLNF